MRDRSFMDPLVISYQRCLSYPFVFFWNEILEKLKDNKFQVDALSRDDLIRFVKKQIDKLKTAKCENERLKTELAEVQKDFTVC